MAVSISIQADVARATASLEGARKQIPFATAQAVNDLAFQVQRAERAAIGSVFAHPRPFTQRSVFVDRASKATPSATVRVGDDQAKYLSPFEFGGLHHLPGKGMALLKPVNMRLDQYGQIRGKPSTIADRNGVFVGRITFRKSGQTVSGIWQRPPAGQRRKQGGYGSKGALNTVGGVRTGLKLLVRFEDAQPVEQHLDFAKRGQQLVRTNFAAAFDAAITKALANVKP
jgi:hypothetical protein